LGTTKTRSYKRKTQLTKFMQTNKTSNYRWSICALLFFATAINYLDRQVLSLTWKDAIVPEFHWTDSDYGNITSVFSIVYAISMLFAGKFIDWIGTKKGFLYAIFFWSIGALLHAYCGIATSGVLKGTWFVGFSTAAENLKTVQDVSKVINVSVVFFMLARVVLAIGEAGNFPASIKTVAEYFPKKDRGFATSVFNSGSTIGAMAAPLSIPFIAKAWGWEMTFIIIGASGFLWMFFWHFMYNKPTLHKKVNKQELAYIQQDDVNDFSKTEAENARRKKNDYR
jgi:MFS transporter, ACS family, hexuronate transporter